MALTKEEVEYLRSFRDNLDNDNIKLKQQIKKRLLSDKYLIHVLHNEELEAADAAPSDYFGVNILPMYIMPDTQHDVHCYVCFETSYEMRYASTMKTQKIIFYILCDEKDAYDPETSLARHDLLAALITNMFNYEIMLGGRFVLSSDVPNITDRHYVTRTLTFYQSTENNIVKTIGGKPKIINKDILCEKSIP